MNSFSKRMVIMAKIIMLLYVASAVTTNAQATKLCKPGDPRTCGYGGECLQVKQSDNFFYLMLYGFRLDDFVCLCRVRCYNKPKQLLCNRESDRTYYNEWCVLQNECIDQAPITISCEGRCDGECRPRAFNKFRRCGLDVNNPCAYDEMCMQDETDSYNVICKK